MTSDYNIPRNVRFQVAWFDDCMLSLQLPLFFTQVASACIYLLFKNIKSWIHFFLIQSILTVPVYNIFFAPHCPGVTSNWNFAFGVSLWLPMSLTRFLLSPQILICNFFFWFFPLRCLCYCHWMPLLFERLGAAVASYETAILHQRPAVVVSTDGLCVLIPMFFLLIPSSILKRGVLNASTLKQEEKH